MNIDTIKKENQNNMENNRAIKQYSRRQKKLWRIEKLVISNVKLAWVNIYGYIYISIFMSIK